MADCTQRRRRPAVAFALPAAVALALSLALPLAGACDRAQADGDPASDVLVSQPLYVPQDASVDPAVAARIEAGLAALARAHAPTRVAVIASRDDLGSVTELWRRPGAYARFLAAELGQVVRGRVIVVMPNGYGWWPGAVPPGLPAPGADLGGGATRALAVLARAHQIELPAGGSALPMAPGRSDLTPWLVFGAGLAIVVVAWALSLRARPARLRPARPGG